MILIHILFKRLIHCKDKIKIQREIKWKSRKKIEGKWIPINLWKFFSMKIQSIFSAAPNFLIFLFDIFSLFFISYQNIIIISLKSFSVSVSWKMGFPNGFSITFYKNQLVGVCGMWRRHIRSVMWEFLQVVSIISLLFLSIHFTLNFPQHNSDQFHSITGKSVTHNLGVVLFLLLL